MGINQLIFDVFGSTVNGASRVLSVGCSAENCRSHSTIATTDMVLTLTKGLMAAGREVSTKSLYRWSDPFYIVAKGLGEVRVRTAPIAPPDALEMDFGMSTAAKEQCRADDDIVGVQELC